MRIPFRLSRSKVPDFLNRPGLAIAGLSSLIQPSDERDFTAALSSLRIGRVFKTTSRSRLPLLLAALRERRERFGSICDVGASDGSASLDFIAALAYDRYVLTDKTLHIFVSQRGERIEAYDSAGRPIMQQSGPLLVYLDPEREWPNLAERLVSWAYGARRRRADVAKLRKVTLVNPAIRDLIGKRVELIEHDITLPWPHDYADLAIVANLLNKFHESPAIMRAAATTLDRLVRPHGLLALAENSSHERATILQRAAEPASYRVLQRINGGSLSEASFLGSFA